MNTITLVTPSGFFRWLRLYALYRCSFPRAERKPFALILKKYRAGMTDIWCIERDSVFLGFSATMNSPRLVMLDYFVIRRRCRGQGIGTAALKKILEKYADREFILEIESPFEPGIDQEKRQKRKQFYVNCGMEPLHIMAEVFGINMELLGKNCDMTFEKYRNFYRDFYRPQAAEHILPADYPEMQ